MKTPIIVKPTLIQFLIASPVPIISLFRQGAVSACAATTRE
jgi:hypothetical protein